MEMNVKAKNAIKSPLGYGGLSVCKSSGKRFPYIYSVFFGELKLHC